MTVNLRMLGLLTLVPVLSLPLSAQDLSEYPQLEASVTRMRQATQDAIFDDYAFSLRVPVQVESVTDQVNAVGVECDLHSSLTDPVDLSDNVGNGIAWIIDQGWMDMNPTDIQARFAWWHWIVADLSLYSGRLTVPIFALHSDDIDAWTHGTCNLAISYGFERFHDGQPRVDQPRDCSDTRAVEPMAVCARAGRELTTLVSFSRPGYDLEGRPIQVTGDR